LIQKKGDQYQLDYREEPVSHCGTGQRRDKSFEFASSKGDKFRDSLGKGHRSLSTTTKDYKDDHASGEQGKANSQKDNARRWALGDKKGPRPISRFKDPAGSCPNRDCLKALRGGRKGGKKGCCGDAEGFTAGQA